MSKIAASRERMTIDQKKHEGGLQMDQSGFQMAKGFAEAVLLKPLGELGGILSDTIGHWRIKNQIRLILKAKEWLEEKKIDPAKILPDVFVPILEEGSKVEDSRLGDMFASLLTSHLDAKTQDRVHPSFPKVLAQLSPLDARGMIEFRRWISDPEYREVGLRGSSMTVGHLSELLEISKTSAYLVALNLNRLGIVQHLFFNPREEKLSIGFLRDVPENQEYRISEYGISFCDACLQFKNESRSYWFEDVTKIEQASKRDESNDEPPASAGGKAEGVRRTATKCSLREEKQSL